MKTGDVHDKDIEDILAASEKIVFFGGAGVSTESGIPDFRSSRGGARGLYRGYAPEELLSASMLREQPEIFFSYYRQNLLHPQARPNRAHQILASWEAQGKVLSVVTQNIDGLHQAAGSKTVWELHGSVHRNSCCSCGKSFGLKEIIQSTGVVPRCDRCGGMVRPRVVLYGEHLDQAVVEGASRAISRAEVLIVGGSSLVVHPAAGLLHQYRGDCLIIVNRDETPWDTRARRVFRGSIGDVLEGLARKG
ncbi:NAD-dependent deacetylase [Alkalispirochaeta sphaeroplastigenens]|uniref:protein acetyllysine N-acetyltransferase n=1 Tax=Alkalispirochaeta sphaeroplastigenens TaxID=1187066 RepID=A0A2S4JZ28_9SPIO|nr:NAD-dependent protein deacylase [Alkalispirochaeta sphaeroplastigenens]POR04759.1 NAD-dependent deacetylase [Alkalispirochaeta sphaeroplastigenens]